MQLLCSGFNNICYRSCFSSLRWGRLGFLLVVGQITPHLKDTSNKWKQVGGVHLISATAAVKLTSFPKTSSSTVLVSVTMTTTGPNKVLIHIKVRLSQLLVVMHVWSDVSPPTAMTTLFKFTGIWFR